MKLYMLVIICCLVTLICYAVDVYKAKKEMEAEANQRDNETFGRITEHENETNGEVNSTGDFDLHVHSKNKESEMERMDSVLNLLRGGR